MFICNTNSVDGDDDDADDDGTFITRIECISFSRSLFTGAERINLHFIKAFQSIK